MASEIRAVEEMEETRSPDSTETSVIRNTLISLVNKNVTSYIPVPEESLFRSMCPAGSRVHWSLLSSKEISGVVGGGGRRLMGRDLREECD